MAISRAEWADWLRMPVTQAVIQSLKEYQDELKTEMIEIKADSIEGYGIEHLQRRSFIAGIGEFLDVEHLSQRLQQAEVLEVPDAS